jgi:hypothetical protein
MDNRPNTNKITTVHITKALSAGFFFFQSRMAECSIPAIAMAASSPIPPHEDVR